MSSSPDFVDSGRFSGRKSAKVPEKSKVSQTCNLLSKYVKENGSLGIGIMRCPPVTEKLPTTMDLFPMAGNSNLALASAGNKSDSETAPLTIFYGEKVLVFNDCSADKFKEIMAFANKESSQYQRIQAFSSRPSTPVQMAGDSTANLVIAQNSNSNSLPRHLPHRIVADLSMARKTSLTRFFEKRKDRLTARAPYSLNKPTDHPSDPTNAKTRLSPSDPTNAKTWLGLGP